jgi:hypothetical protein
MVELGEHTIWFTSISANDYPKLVGDATDFGAIGLDIFLYTIGAAPPNVLNAEALNSYLRRCRQRKGRSIKPFVQKHLFEDETESGDLIFLDTEHPFCSSNFHPPLTAGIKDFLQERLLIF